MSAITEIELNGTKYRTGGTSTQRKVSFLRTDNMRVGLCTNERLLCDFCSGGEWADSCVKPLTLRRIRRSDDTKQIEALYNWAEKQKVAIVTRQPLNSKRETVGIPMSWTGAISEVCCDPYDAGSSKTAFLTVLIAKPTLVKH